MSTINSKREIYAYEGGNLGISVDKVTSQDYWATFI